MNTFLWYIFKCIVLSIQTFLKSLKRHKFCKNVRNCNFFPHPKQTSVKSLSKSQNLISVTVSNKSVTMDKFTQNKQPLRNGNQRLKSTFSAQKNQRLSLYSTKCQIWLIHILSLISDAETVQSSSQDTVTLLFETVTLIRFLLFGHIFCGNLLKMMKK